MTLSAVRWNGGCGILYRVPKLAVLYLPAYFLFLKLYPFTPTKVGIFPGE